MIGGMAIHIGQGVGIVHEIDDDQEIEMTVAEVEIEIIEAGEKTPESAIANVETILLTLNGKLGERKVGRGIPPSLLLVSLAR